MFARVTGGAKSILILTLGLKAKTFFKSCKNPRFCLTKQHKGETNLSDCLVCQTCKKKKNKMC